MNRSTTFIGMFAILALASAVQAQPGGGFFGGGVAYDPEISVVSSGVVLDAQATVSADRKYVNLTMRPTLSRLQQLVPFTVAELTNGNGGGQGFVGGGLMALDENHTPVKGPAPAHVKNSPSEIGKIDPTVANSVLRKHGMTMVRALK